MKMQLKKRARTQADTEEKNVQDTQNSTNFRSLWPQLKVDNTNLSRVRQQHEY